MVILCFEINDINLQIVEKGQISVKIDSSHKMKMAG